MVERESLLSKTFVDLADTLLDDFDVIDLLTVLAHRTVELLDADAAGILLADDSRDLHVVAASSERAQVMELFQLQNHEGPCLDCFATGEPVSNTDLASTGRWPRFAPEAVRSGFQSVHALPLRLRDHVIGGLNIFLGRVGGLTTPDVLVARALADAATIAILQEQASRRSQMLTEQLQGALNSRIAIEQAKGVLAERAGVDMDEAFDRLRRYARDNSQKLSVLATELVDGTLTAAALARLVSHR